MQASAAPVKKPSSFKCPAFSVPVKPKTEQNVTKKSTQLNDATKEVKVKKSASAKPVENTQPGGDNTGEKFSKTVALPDSSGDTKQPSHNKVESNSEVKEKPAQEAPTPVDNIEGNNSSKVIKKKKSDFKLKTKTKVDAKDISCKKKEKPKKKKDVGDKQKKVEVTKTDVGDDVGDKQKKVEVTKTDVGDDSRKEQGIVLEKQKEKKIKQPKEKKDPKENKPKAPVMPVRSLTDDEYYEIFDAAIENAMNLNMEEWEPKCTSPLRVREPVKKKFSITVGKKDETKDLNTIQEIMKPTEEDEKQSEENNREGDLKPDEENEDVVKIEANEVEEKPHESNLVEEAPEEKVEDTQNQGEVVEDGENKGVDENNNVEQIDHQDDDDGENNDDDLIEAEVIPDQQSAQQINETTPAGSEADPVEKKPGCANTPVKKKKKLYKMNKKPKLEPKHLPFEKKSEAPMLDKIQHMKKRKGKPDEKHRKRKLDQSSRKNEKKPKIGSHAVIGKRRPKSMEKKESKRQKMQHRELDLNGTWVQCCNSTCMKWRYLSDISDPTSIPERWTCSMNSNEEYNSCEKAEESYDESEHIYTKFSEGSVVWARMIGYPWWPAMVEIDPNTESFFSIDTDDSMFPTHYHVVFFDDHVSRAWVKVVHIKAFSGDEDDDGILFTTPKKGKSYSKEIAIAKKNARRALFCSVKERIEQFGFAARYKGPWESKVKEKSNCSKQESRTKKTVPDVDVECLDDDTIDDVIDNTEALLDNVEEMLDSIDGQLMDTDADSDFAPDELVVVETKTKRKDKRNSLEENHDIREKTLIDENSDIVIENVNVEELENEEATVKNAVIEADDRDSKTDAAPTSSNSGCLKLNLDSDIFTMEMDENVDNATTENVESKANTENTKKSKKKGNSKKDAIAAKVVPNMESNKKEEMEEITTVTDEDAKDVEADKKECDTVPVVNDCGSETDKNEAVPQEGAKSEEEKSTEMELDTSINKIDDLKDNCSNDVDEVDAAADNVDENNSVVPDLSMPSPVRAHEQNPVQSLGDDSDNEFDLEEHYMYETNTDGSDKVRERALALNPNIHEVEEDSDPFDLMEE